MKQAVADHSTVLLINGAGDSELTGVHAALAGLPSVLFHSLDGSVGFDVDARTVHIDGRAVRPAVTWVRHCGAGTLTAHRPVSALAAASWSGLLGQIADAAAVALPGTAPDRTAQVGQAARLGVRTPRTVVTTDVAAGARQVGAPRVIVKTPDFRLVEPDPRAWAGCLPQVLDTAATPGGRSPAGRPVVVQEYVAHAAELRVYHLNGGVCAFRVDKPDPAATWTDPAAVRVTAVDCPAAAVSVVQRLAAAWGLRYAAFDLLVTGAGEIVFLEANPDGDWLWYERRAGRTGVTFLAAAMVRELYQHVRLDEEGDR
ncbi:hypothetical protein [Actinoplanes sp. N902-109]|uniref:hypothetical protein n=1 Tax=Actinoplanes sp. (strain N902-109) TaxID=649831 RepID=UPI0003295B09|nr:hypothetical protein [Actinoplanes sp. N902-109]AGL17735.1 hypothetical protein L083_4225 [Actinoplanes sp. N902-109]